MPRKEVVKELDKEQRIKKHNDKKKGEDKEKVGLNALKVKPKAKRTGKKDFLRDYESGNFEEDEYYM